MPRIYVGTYAKYNSGSLKGKWFDMEEYACKGDFLEACQEFHGPGEHEFMFQDHEGIPRLFIGESWIDEKFWDYMDSWIDPDVKDAYADMFDSWDEEECNSRYVGKFDSWDEVGEHIIEETGLLHGTNDIVQQYFDYSAYARDLRLSGDLTEHDHHYFWNT